MSLIYEPKGKAREYSPLALNLYLGCSHECKYCYAPSCLQRKRENYFGVPEPRKNVLEKLEKELRKSVPKEQVLLSFVGDVYCETTDNNKLTRDVLEMLLHYGAPVAVLTKGIKRSTKDIDLFKKFGEHIQVGTTLTFDNDADSLEWEPGAETPSERIEGLKILHEAGIRTFASFEPVIIPEQSLSMMRKTLEVVDVYKVGKLNNYKGIDKKIDWSAFLAESVALLRGAWKEFYIKDDLRKNAPSVALYGDEAMADKHNVV